MKLLFSLFCILSCILLIQCKTTNSIIALNTWPWPQATQKAFDQLALGHSSLDAVEAGASQCEIDRCDHSVGFDGSPNEKKQVTLDALIMNGQTREVGAVANMKGIKTAVKVARKVMELTYHSLLVGEDASDFAQRIGGIETHQNLTGPYATQLYEQWIQNNKKPNYWKKQPPPPLSSSSDTFVTPNSINHDTVGIIARDNNGNSACATSTNGLNFRIPGRVGDSAIVGSGCYVENEIGGAAGTGQGDVLLRFAPAMRAVFFMKYLQLSAREACAKAMEEIPTYFPDALGALVCIDFRTNEFSAYALGEWANVFQFAVRNETMKEVQLFRPSNYRLQK